MASGLAEDPDASGRTASYLEIAAADHSIVDVPEQSDDDRRGRKGRRETSFQPELWSTERELALSWHGVGYKVEYGKKVRQESGKKVKRTKQILEGLTGELLPGEMCCIMGTSGSGKTSMLNVLSGRHVDGQVQGRVLCNNRSRGASFRRLSAYVEQDDCMFTHLTVYETLLYTALLRLPGSMKHVDKLARVDDVINQLGLVDCKGTRIGNASFRGVSGGERKRCSIGMEIMVNPRILFLDEPTSGLDAYTAFHIMETVRELTRSGRSVICSIHQPREKIFFLFDKIMLLSQGKTCYYGPTGEVSQFFAACGHEKPQNENVADFLLDITTVDLRNERKRKWTEDRVLDLQNRYSKSEFSMSADRASDTRLKLARGTDKIQSAPISGTRRWNLRWFGEFSTLLSRAWLNVRREPRTSKIAIIQALMMGLITGLVFFDLDNTQQGIRDLQGVLFFVTLNNAFMALSAVVVLFHEEKQVFNRERNAGAYRVSSYFMAKSSAELPMTLFPICIYTSIFYFMVNLKREADAFFLTLLALAVLVLTAQSFGMLISASAPSLKAAQILAPLSTVVLMLFGGFYIGVDSLWDGWAWLEALSFMQYCYVALLRVQFDETTWSCDTRFGNSYCLSTGDEVLEQLGFDDVDRSYWHEIGKLVAILVLFRVIAYLSLRFCYRQKLHLE